MPKKTAQKRMPVAPRKPAVGTKKPMAKKSGVTVVLPNGSTVGLKDLGKVKPTPKPKPKPKTTFKTRMTPQDTFMKKILEKKNGKIYG